MPRLYRFFGYCLLTAGAVSMIIPFIYMICLSFMTEEQVFSGNSNFIPAPFTAGNYTYVIKNCDIFRYFYNSMFVSAAASIGQVMISSAAGYAFARYSFKYKELLFFLITASMMLPPQVNIVPLFFLMKQFHWLDTYWALIIPGMFGGFGVFMMRRQFEAQPLDIEEAAEIDGCNAFEVFYKTALPLAMPAVITLFIFTFITMWNSFMWPLIAANSEAVRTLPVGLAEFKGSFREAADWGALAAYSVICAVPAIAVFIAGRKYFINDILSGGVKE